MKISSQPKKNFKPIFDKGFIRIYLIFSQQVSFLNEINGKCLT